MRRMMFIYTIFGSLGKDQSHSLSVQILTRFDMQRVSYFGNIFIYLYLQYPVPLWEPLPKRMVMAKESPGFPVSAFFHLFLVGFIVYK